MNTEINNRIIEKQFTSTKELYHWLGQADMDKLKEGMTNKYGKHKAEVDLENMQLIITKTTNHANIK